jgi:hypothetical protein
VIHAIQHVPGFVDMKPNEARVETLDELLEVPWIKAWKEDRRFYRFSRSEGHRLLIAERDRGREWYVVARIRGDIGALPTWEYPKGKAN